MRPDQRMREHLWQHITTIVLLSVVVGCADDTGGFDGDSADVVTVELSSGETVEVDAHHRRMRLPTGEVVPAKRGKMTVQDSMILVAKDGTVSTHRKPNAISQELVRLPTLYLRPDTLERVVSEDGYKGNAYVDPASGQLCWIALTCTSAQCASAGPDHGPLLFVSPESGVTVDDDGNIVRSFAQPNAWPRCPNCRKQKTVEKYDLPEVLARRAELHRELDEVRAARDKHEQNFGG